MADEEIANQLTAEEQVELQKYLGANAPTPEAVHNVHKFLADVSEADDTTKTGYLMTEELGNPILPVRTQKELALYCRDVANMPEMADFLEKEAEITSATSLSKDAKLITLAVTTTRQLADVTKKPKKENKSWFKSKKKGGDEE